MGVQGLAVYALETRTCHRVSGFRASSLQVFRPLIGLIGFRAFSPSYVAKTSLHCRV